MRKIKVWVTYDKKFDYVYCEEVYGKKPARRVFPWLVSKKAYLIIPDLKKVRKL